MSASFVELNTADSIETAANKVANHIDLTVESSDIFDKLTQHGTTTLSGLGDKFYAKGAPEFYSSRRIPIPGELAIQMKNVHIQFSMGFFTAINRVWIVIDNNLYMWNYETNDDLAFFDSCETTILRVALVKVKPNVFEAGVTYGLVIGTISDISLYPILYNDDPSQGQISIDVKQFFQVNLENNSVGDIVCTNDGRIFYTTNDQLFEFAYERQNGWFRKGNTCSAINRTATVLGTLIKLPFFGSDKEELEQVSVDKSRNILYCLGKSGSILVFDLGANGQECRKVTSLTAGQIAHEANLLTQFGHEESTFTNITSICALEATQSNQFNLVAVTVKGVRLYFSVLARAFNGGMQAANGQSVFVQRAQNVNQSDVRPACLRVAHVRFSPGIAPTSIYGDGPRGVTVAYVNENLCAMATANRNIVWTLSNFFYPSSKLYCESITECQVPGHVWEMEVVTDVKVVAKPVNRNLVERVKPHSYYRQQVEGTTRLLVCSNEGVYEYTQMNSTEALREALFDGGLDGKAVMQLWQKLGSTEMLIVALRILASETGIDERLKTKAEQILYSLKDAPEMVEGERTMHETSRVWSPNDTSIAEWKTRMRSPLFASTPRGENILQQSAYAHSPFSSAVPLNTSMTGGDPTSMRMAPSRRHDALYYYFSRLVMPIWNHTICEVINGKQLDTTFDVEAIKQLCAEVRKLGRVMDDYRLVPTVDFAGNPTNTSDRLNAEASSLERQSLVGLRRLVDATVETLSLWVLAKDYNLPAMSAGMNPALLPNFASRRLSQLVADSSNLNGELIRAMIKFFLGDDAGTRQLSENLRSLCPNLYSEDDACVTHGMEQLEAAKRAGPGANRRKLVNSALSMFKQSILKVSLQATCQQLADMVGAYEQVVELCLLRASRDDSKQLALLSYKHGRGAEDGEMRLAERKRAACYKVITDELDKLEEECVKNGEANNESAVNRDVMIAAVLSSDDQLAHAAVFRWLLEKKKTNAILQSKSPYVEFFLCQEIQMGHGGQKYFDLLWKFYEKSGNFEKAARLLTKLAENDSWEINLVQRCSYLSHAIMCAQSSKEPKVAESIEDLRDRLDVANIQVRVKDALDLPNERNQELVKTLDRQIFSLEQLLVKFVVPYKLHKIKLAIFHCANMYIEEHIFETWESILQEEFLSARDESSLCENLLCTIGELNNIYRSTKYFPTDFIIRRIMSLGSGNAVGAQRLPLPSAFYASLCRRINISLVDFLKLAAAEFNAGSAWWTENESGQFYITDVVRQVTRTVLAEIEKMPPVQRVSSARECIMHTMSFLRRARDVSSSLRLQAIGDDLDSLQTRLSAF